MTIAIVEERPDSPAAAALIMELEALLEPLYPSESRHGYSVAQLLAQGVAFFVLRTAGEPAACGGVQIFADYGEVKRMFVRPQYRGQGFAQAILDRLVAYTRAQNRSWLRLETGIHQHAAIRLYENAGFVRIGPFGDYRDDPLSVFYEKQIG